MISSGALGTSPCASTRVGAAGRGRAVPWGNLPSARTGYEGGVSTRRGCRSTGLGRPSPPHVPWSQRDSVEKVGVRSDHGYAVPTVVVALQHTAADSAPVSDALEGW